MHTGLLDVPLEDGWKVKKARAYTSALLGHPDKGFCVLIRTATESDEDFHLLSFLEDPAEKVSVGENGQMDNWEVYSWHDLTRLMTGISKCGTVEEARDFWYNFMPSWFKSNRLE
jgi:hypothetical protein